MKLFKLLSLSKKWWADVVFVGGLLFPVLFIYAWGGRHFDDWWLLVPIVPVCLFSVPLCQTFRNGIHRARETIEQGAGAPRRAFWIVLCPHIALWVAALAAYVVLLEWHFFVVGTPPAIISAPTVGLVLLMFARCFLWAPRCKRFWALALLSLFTPLLFSVLLWGGSMVLVCLLGLEGYMGLGYWFYPPLITSLGLLIGATFILVRVWRAGDAWFRSPEKRILIVSELMCALFGSLAYGKKSLLSEAFWKTATVEDVNSAVAEGADVNARNFDGYTALLLAVGFNTDPDVIERLVELGADVNPGRIWGRTALMIATYGNTNLKVIDLLVKRGADVNARDDKGRTALMMEAMSNPNPEVIELLLSFGADASYKNKSGQTALGLVEENKSLKGAKAYQMLKDAANKVK